nr:hypothetical protein [Tanacetum cinerariifolium]
MYSPPHRSTASVISPPPSQIYPAILRKVCGCNKICGYVVVIRYGSPNMRKKMENRCAGRIHANTQRFIKRRRNED